MMTTKRFLALMTASAFLLSAVAMPAAAEDDEHDESDAYDDSYDHDGNETADNDARKDAAKERRDAARDEAKERRDAAKDEAKERRDAAKEAAKAHKAQRAHKALEGAIHALEHRIVKLEFLEHRIEAALEDGNLSANETAELESKLERVEAAQEKAMERLKHLYDKQKELRQRWHDHIHGDDADDPSDVDDDEADDLDDETDEEDADGNETGDA